MHTYIHSSQISMHHRRAQDTGRVVVTIMLCLPFSNALLECKQHLCIHVTSQPIYEALNPRAIKNNREERGAISIAARGVSERFRTRYSSICSMWPDPAASNGGGWGTDSAHDETTEGEESLRLKGMYERKQSEVAMPEDIHQTRAKR